MGLAFAILYGRQSCGNGLVSVAFDGGGHGHQSKVLHQRLFTSAWHKSPNMDTLVAMGAGASFGYSVYALFAMTGAQMAGDMDGVMKYLDSFYFESAAMILTLITVGKMLEAYSKGKDDRCSAWADGTGTKTGNDPCGWCREKGADRSGQGG